MIAANLLSADHLIKEIFLRLDVTADTYNPALKRLRQENSKFNASLSYIVRPVQRSPKQILKRLGLKR